jgi:hypothetical protein
LQLYFQVDLNVAPRRGSMLDRSQRPRVLVNQPLPLMHLFGIVIDALFCEHGNRYENSFSIILHVNFQICCKYQESHQ